VIVAYEAGLVSSGGWRGNDPPGVAPLREFLNRPFDLRPALVVRNDVVSGVFGRLGMVGAILLVSALIFGAIAGGVVVHRLQSAPAASTTQQRGDNADEQGDGQSTQKPPKHAAHPSPEPDDTQDKEA
jgi:hypothetical protein